MSRPHRLNANHPNDFNSIYEMTIFEIVGSGGGSDLVIKAARVAIAALLNSSDAIRRLWRRSRPEWEDGVAGAPQRTGCSIEVHDCAARSG